MEDVEYELQGIEEAEEQNLAQGEKGPDRDLARPSKEEIQNKANKT